MIYQLLILFSVLVILKCRGNSSEIFTNHRIHYVNLTDGRRDLSIVGSVFDNKLLFKVLPGFSNGSFVVRATFIEQINSTGWGHLLVESSPKYRDEIQAYLAGVIEGIITRPLIAAHWSNTYQGYCDEPSKYCSALFKYLKQNFVSLVTKSRNSSGFLKMIRLQLWQIKGLQDGYDNDWKNNIDDINELHLLSMWKQLFKLYLLQADCDLGELAKILHGTGYHDYFVPLASDGRCSAIIKYVKGSIYTAHVTWSPYNNMLRLTKLYNFPYRIGANEQSSDFVPAIKLSFSSYPGQLSSLDDFYITSAGLVTTETTIGNFNDSLYEPYRDMASEVVLEYARTQAANRLAKSGSDWTKVFSQNNSGTYSNQWMIIDYNLMKYHRDGDRIPDGVLYVLEQIPSLVVAEDVTEYLRTQTYWPSYNIPFNKTIWHIGNFQSFRKKMGELFDYNNCSRALMFKRNASSVVDEESLIRLMRYNDFKHDPLSKCDCNPPYSANLAISSRNDLNMKSGKYPFDVLEYRLQGGTDLKFTTSDLMKSMRFVGISGPTYDQQPVFDWRKITGSTMKHNMQPERFEFPPVCTPFT